MHCSYLAGELEDKTARWIWSLGLKCVFQWIIDITIGIL
jgi:hypothetical protein